MKTLKLTLATLTVLAFAVFTYAKEQSHKHSHGHSHEHGPAKNAAGPNGGKILKSLTPKAEFFLTSERKIQITFLDNENKVIPAGEQSIKVITGDRSAPTTLTFVKAGNVFISETAVPEGKNLPVVIQVKPLPDAATQTAKLNLNLSICSGCNLAEYACTCGH